MIVHTPQLSRRLAAALATFGVLGIPKDDWERFRKTAQTTRAADFTTLPGFMQELVRLAEKVGDPAAMQRSGYYDDLLDDAFRIVGAEADLDLVGLSRLWEILDALQAARRMGLLTMLQQDRATNLRAVTDKWGTEVFKKFS